MNYREFIQSKVAVADYAGFDIDPTEIVAAAHPHQKALIVWAIKGGRRALFAKPGLGKTLMQNEIIRLIRRYRGGISLTVCPLDVMREFFEAAKEFNLDMPLVYVRNDAEAEACPSPYHITNYERVRDGGLSVGRYKTVTLDEAAVLRSYGSKTFQEFLPLFKDIEYRFVCTATPSPNRYKELIHYSAFLGVMDSGQALTRFFKRDSTKANQLTLYPHKEKEFHLWLQTWACFLMKPSNLGYSDEGYELPPLDIVYHKVDVDHSLAGVDRDGQMLMFRDSAMSLPAAAREKRLTMISRIAKMKAIIDESPNDHFLIWHDLDDEKEEIKRVLPEVKILHGSMSVEDRSPISTAFAYGELKYLATKKKISGSGNNFQRYCHRAIFVGIDDKFNDFFQAIHRIYRYLQNERVRIDVIYAESESNTLERLKRKWRQHLELTERQSKQIEKYGLNAEVIRMELKRTIGVKRVEETGKYYRAVQNDCVEETATIKSDSVHLVHTSIPFSNHYEYTPTYDDFGHNVDNDQFFRQMDYLTPELLRVMIPGRVAAIHVKDRILFGNATGDGMPTVDPFSDLTVAHFMKHGFRYMGRITIETDVVRENNQTYRLGYSEQCKDGSKMGVGCPEYLLLFRKLPTDTGKAYSDLRVEKLKEEYSLPRWQIDAAAKWVSSGDRFLTPEEIDALDLKNLATVFGDRLKHTVYDYHAHVKTLETMDEAGKMSKTFETVTVPARKWYIWDDVNRMRTLNEKQKRRDLQLHVCPLQFDIVRRVIERWSNPGELVYDPFGGIMTVPLMAVKMGRYGYGVELSAEYWRDGVNYLQEAEMERDTPTLFDVAGY